MLTRHVASRQHGTVPEFTRLQGARLPDPPDSQGITEAQIGGRTIITLLAIVDPGVTMGGAKTQYILNEMVPQFVDDYPNDVIAGGCQKRITAIHISAGIQLRGDVLCHLRSELPYDNRLVTQASI